jgi:hypothetical protein
MNSLHIYAFGSLCRGEFGPDSDVDLLAIVSGGRNQLSRKTFSIYSHKRIREIWNEGNAFAWHLHLEARPIHLCDGRNFLSELGRPSRYSSQAADCEKFLNLLRTSRRSVEADHQSLLFDLSSVFLAIRNFSTCFMLGNGEADFSRNVALRFMGTHPPVSLEVYRALERARLICTRGIGEPLQPRECLSCMEALVALEDWMTKLMGGIDADRFQQSGASATRNG